MRYLDRSSMTPPKALFSPRMQAARERLAEYLAIEDQSRRNRLRAPVDLSLLSDPALGEDMLPQFGGCCAYCETPLDDVRGVIGHHRPPGGAANRGGSGSSLLHYVWLAYAWENLLPVCAPCNRRKANIFPVEGERGTIGASVERLRAQEPMAMLDPTHDDVAAGIVFGPDGVAQPRNVPGKTAIETLALNERGDLVEARKTAIRTLAMGLAKAPESTRAVATGFARGWSSHVATIGTTVQRHAGAATLALMARGSEKFGKPFDGLPQLLEFLTMLPPSERNEFLQPLLSDQADAGSVAGGQSKMMPPAPRKRRPSRAISLAGLPAARLPLSRVAISNFKALAKLDLTLPDSLANPEQVPCMLVLGENATGKSTVLEAISLALLGTRECAELDKLLEEEDITPREFQHRPDPDNWEMLAAEPFRIEIGFTGLDDEACLSSDTGLDEFTGSTTPSRIVLAYGPRRFFVKKPMRRYRAPAYRVRSLFDPMAVMPNPIAWLLSLEQQERFDAAARALRVLLMLREDADILRGDNQILIDTPQGRTPLSKLSVGYKSVVALAVDIMRELFNHYDNLENADAVVLIDEIETHLHPRWKMQIVRLLRQAFPKVQFILTTHDPLCLRGMGEGEVFVLQRSEDNARIETLEELPSVQGMRAEQILTSEFFGLGSTDPATDAKLERYHYLTRKPDRDAREQNEWEQLGREIDSRMMVGTDIAEQADAAAMSQATSSAEFGEIPSRAPVREDRKAMIARALDRLRSQ